MSSRLAVAGLGLIVFAGACGGSAAPETPSSTTAPPTTVTTTPPTTDGTTVPPVEASTAPPTTAGVAATTSEAPIPAWPSGTTHVLYGLHGILAMTEDGDTVPITDEPTAVAMGIRDEVVLSQAASNADSTPLTAGGPIVVHDASGSRPLPGDPGEELRLYDIAEIDGAPYAVASVVTGDGPESTVERLALVDVATGSRIMLAEVGGWEWGADDARVAGETLVVAVGGVPHSLEGRSLRTGELLWRAGGSSFDRNVAVAVVGDRVLQLSPQFRGDDFRPFLVFEAFSVADGTWLGLTELEVRTEFGGGFCLEAVWDGGDHLLCSESYGGPFWVDLESGEVEPLSDLPKGAARPTKA